MANESTKRVVQDGIDSQLIQAAVVFTAHKVMC